MPWGPHPAPACGCDQLPHTHLVAGSLGTAGCRKGHRRRHPAVKHSLSREAFTALSSQANRVEWPGATGRLLGFLTVADPARSPYLLGLAALGSCPRSIPRKILLSVLETF